MAVTDGESGRKDISLEIRLLKCELKTHFKMQIELSKASLPGEQLGGKRAAMQYYHDRFAAICCFKCFSFYGVFLFMCFSF